MKILIACEHSGVVRDAFAEYGHDVWSCDLRPSSLPGNHLQCDVLTVIECGWDMMIAHPPCEYLTYAGNAHWDLPGRAELRSAAMAFFMKMINAPISKICVENPRGLPHVEYRKPDQVIHPYMFGDSALKRTGLWLKNLPPLWWSKRGELFQCTSVEIPKPISIDATGKKRHWTDGAKRDPMERSKTFPGIAAAMAAQWGAI